MGACPARDRLSYMIPQNEVVDHAMTQTTVQTGQDAGRIGHVPKPKISSAQNDARYVARGKAATMKADPAWDRDLEEANRGKRGRPFKYPDGLIEMIAIFRMITGMGYRECEGVAAKSMGGECAPDHTTICKRINRMEIKAANGNLEAANGDGAVQMIIDGTGMIPSTRGEWIRHKWKIKRGFIRLSIMVDAKTRKILAFVITDETVGESPQLPSMLDEALEKLGIPKDPAKRASQVVVLLGDKGYDSRANFSHCGKRGVVALIPVRINANCRADGVDRARAEAVIEQLGGGRIPRRGPATAEGRADGQPEGLEEAQGDGIPVDCRDSHFVVQEDDGRVGPRREVAQRHPGDIRQDPRLQLAAGRLRGGDEGGVGLP